MKNKIVSLNDCDTNMTERSVRFLKLAIESSRIFIARTFKHARFARIIILFLIKKKRWEGRCATGWRFVFFCFFYFKKVSVIFQREIDQFQRNEIIYDTKRVISLRPNSPVTRWIKLERTDIKVQIAKGWNPHLDCNFNSLYGHGMSIESSRTMMRIYICTRVYRYLCIYVPLRRMRVICR